MNPLQVLHSLWMSERIDSSEIKQSWKDVNNALREKLPENKQDDFLDLINVYCCKLEYQAFKEGFKTATELFETIKN